MSEKAPEKPRKIVVERIGPPDGLDLLTAKLAKVQAAAASALSAYHIVRPAIDASDRVSAASTLGDKLAQMSPQLPKVELPDARAARDRRHAAKQTEQMLGLLGDMLEEMRHLAEAGSLTAAEARRTTGKTDAVIVLTVLGMASALSVSILAATSSWAFMALTGVLTIVAGAVVVRLFGSRT